MNIRVDLNTPIFDGAEVVFRSPVDCSQITGLIVYCPENGNTISKEFAFADAHGNNVGDIDHLFAENVVVKVILDVTTSMAFVQNADTNAYLESRFAQLDRALSASELAMVDKLCPSFTESGSVVTCEPVEGYPLGVVSGIDVKQSGSDTPSPDNIRPFVEHTAVKLTRCGKNLFKPTDILRGYTASDGNGTYKIIEHDSSITCYIPCKPNTTYTVSKRLGQRFTVFTTNEFPAIGSTAYLKAWDATQSTATVTTGANAKYLCAFVYNKNFDTSITESQMLNSVQFELGASATAYESYAGDTFTMELGQSIYGGTLDWNTGLLTIDWVAEEVTKFVSVNYAGFANFNTKKKIVYNGTNVYHTCSHYPAGKYNSSYPNNYSYAANDNLIVTIDYTHFSTLETANAYLAEQKAAGTPVQICYKLANPTTVQLTPKEIKALAGVNTIHSDTGDTTVNGKTSPATEIEKLKNAILAMGANV